DVVVHLISLVCVVLDRFAVEAPCECGEVRLDDSRREGPGKDPKRRVGSRRINRTESCLAKCKRAVISKANDVDHVRAKRMRLFQGAALPAYFKSSQYVVRGVGLAEERVIKIVVHIQAVFVRDL